MLEVAYRLGVVVDLLIQGGALYLPALIAAVLLVRISGFAVSIDEIFERLGLFVFFVTFFLWESSWVLRAVFFFDAFTIPITRSERVVVYCIGIACELLLLTLASCLLVIAVRRALARAR